eukprot:scaffold37041_cov55-Phaeocystis_antarctica.AAC.4
MPPGLASHLRQTASAGCSCTAVAVLWCAAPLPVASRNFDAVASLCPATSVEEEKEEKAADNKATGEESAHKKVAATTAQPARTE